MEKKYLNLIYSLYSLCRRILPLQNLVIKNSQKIAFFANFKAERIFARINFRKLIDFRFFAEEIFAKLTKIREIREN